MTSYSNKRRKIQIELQGLESTDYDTEYTEEDTNLVLTPLKESDKLNENQNNMNFDNYYNQCYNSDKSASDHILPYGNEFNKSLSEFDLIVSSDNEEIVPIIANYSQKDFRKKKLCHWAVNYNVPQNAVDGLLEVLRNDFDLDFLPKRCKTLLGLGSSKVINIRQVEPGIYYHFGLAFGIKRFTSIINFSDNLIKISIGIDGLPISKSSGSCFWPILAYIQPYSKHVFIVGIYHGYEKPKDSNIYLQDLIEEILDLTQNGILINNVKQKMSINVICCDSPAKSFIMRIKSHSGYFSCPRCTHEGEYFSSVCFPFNSNGNTERYHDDYICMKDEEHHTHPTISCLALIPDTDIVKLFSMDYMHLVCLGITKKLLVLWLGIGKNKSNGRLSSWKIQQITDGILKVKSSITCDFARKPRPVKEVLRWKATEFRQFILYTGIIVLKDILSNESYNNFLALSISMRILLCENNHNYLNFTRELLKYFVESFQYIYGVKYVSQNVHGLLHLCDDYERHGPLNVCSTFPFENYMKILKKMIRKHDKPLQQVVLRYTEHCNNEFIEKTKINKLQFKTKKPDCYVLTLENEIVQITDLKKSIPGKCSIIVGKIFIEKKELFTMPLKSSKLDIYVVKNLSENEKQWKISDIKRKMIMFDLKNTMIAIPILHHD